ncbi:MAG: iron-sulfur cluster assembly accessory protein [Fimbriimonadaceae bacterium]|nr:iron-sulfur cluster assembly accessory protein [Fimbriimonadaceae bacterium]
MADFPLEIEAAAAAILRSMLERKGSAGQFVRIGVKGGGCTGLEYVVALDDRDRDGDLCLWLEGVKVVCDPKSSEFLAGSVLRASGNLIGGGLKFDNPNAARSCGCGSSFTPRER